MELILSSTGMFCMCLKQKSKEEIKGEMFPYFRILHGVCWYYESQFTGTRRSGQFQSRELWALQLKRIAYSAIEAYLYLFGWIQGQKLEPIMFLECLEQNMANNLKEDFSCRVLGYLWDSPFGGNLVTPDEKFHLSCLCIFICRLKCIIVL